MLHTVVTASLLTSSDVNTTSGGSPDRPFVFESGMALYLASTMPYMFDTLPPALTIKKLLTLNLLAPTTVGTLINP